MSGENGSPHRTAKRIIQGLIITVVAVDAIVAGTIVYRSECPIAEFFKRHKANELPAYFASKVRLRTTEQGLDQWDTPQGPIWTVHGDTILPFLLAEQNLNIYEPPGHEVRPGDVVLDCGANIGMFTRRALSRGARLVVAIEPAPDTLRALRRNFEREITDGRVVVYAKGVWDRESEMDLSVHIANEGRNSLVLTDNAQATVRVPLTTIDRIVAELKLPRVDFIKMDIEGAEKPAISGGQDTIRRFRPRMSLSTEHLPDDFTAIPALVNSIAPNYKHKSCDCVWDGGRMLALVLAFDPT